MFEIKDETASDDEFIVSAFQEESDSSNDEATKTDVYKKRKLPEGSSGSIAKKQRSSPDTTECDDAEERWPQRSISLMLNLRFQLYKIFERDDEDVQRRAWKKIASMLFPLTVTWEDCFRTFDSLTRKYLASYDPNLGAIACSEEEEEHFRFIEKLLRKSPKIRQQYLGSDELCSEKPNVGDAFLELLANDTSTLGKSLRQLIRMRKRQKERDRVFEEIIEDLVAMQEQKYAMEREFLKKFVYAEFGTRDEQLGMLAQVILCLECSTSTPISVLDQVRREINQRADRWYSISVSMCAYSTLLEKLFDVSDEEETLWLRLLPDAAHFFVPTAAVANHVVLNEFGFKGLLRMERTTIEKVIEVFGPSAPAKLGKFKPVSIERMVLLSVWYLVHDETFDQLSVRFSIRRTDVCRAISVFVSVISDAADLIEWPEKASDLKKTVLGFENIRDASFPGVVGAVGSKNFCVQPPDVSDKELAKENSYIIDYGIIVQAVADADSVFRHVDVRWITLDQHLAGRRGQWTLDNGSKIVSMPDMVFSFSPLSRTLARRLDERSNGDKLAFLPDRLHVLGNSSYPLLPSLMVPFDSATGDLKPRELLFNKQCELSWSVVAKAFGKTISRFQRLSNLDNSLCNCSNTIKVIFALHNICMKEGDNYPSKKVQLNEIPMWFEKTPQPEALRKRQSITNGFVHENIDYAFRGQTQERSLTRA